MAYATTSQRWRSVRSLKAGMTSSVGGLPYAVTQFEAIDAP